MQSALAAAQQLTERLPAASHELSMESAAQAEAVRIRFGRLLKSAERIRYSLAEEAMGASQSCSSSAKETVCVEELLYRH